MLQVHDVRFSNGGSVRGPIPVVFTVSFSNFLFRQKFPKNDEITKPCSVPYLLSPTKILQSISLIFKASDKNLTTDITTQFLV